MQPYRIIIADDHVMFRQAIKRIIEEKGDLKVVGEVGDGVELLRLLNRLTPDMVIMDISMPNLRGIEATREVKQVRPEVRILILTMHRNREYLVQSINLGAEGFLLKDDGSSELIFAIEAIRRGNIYLSPCFSGQLPDVFKHSSRDCLKDFTPMEPLTTRERQILKLVAEGKSSKEIADLLFISVRTVQHHRASIMRKLEIKRTVDLVKYAIEKGYTSTDN